MCFSSRAPNCDLLFTSVASITDLKRPQRSTKNGGNSPTRLPTQPFLTCPRFVCYHPFTDRTLFNPKQPFHTVSSPAATASPIIGGSLKTADALGLRQRIKTICKTVLENHLKWLAVQRRGSALCAQIEACKKSALDECRSDGANQNDSIVEGKKTNPSTVYPEDLRLPCAKFKVIITILDDVLTAAGDAERQLLAIQRLQEQQNAGTGIADASPTTAVPNAVFKTWPIARFVHCVSDLRAAYALELPVRRKCMQEIAHARSHEELLLHCCVWDFPCYVSETRWTVAILSLRHECDIDEVTASQSPASMTPIGTKKREH